MQETSTSGQEAFPAQSQPAPAPVRRVGWIGRVTSPRRGRPHHLAALAVVLTMLLGITGLSQRGAAQEDTTPAAGSPNAQVIAQGLAFFDADAEYVWRVREIAPPPEAEAASAAAVAYSFLLQRTGATIIRNDVSQRRARIEPGEAYYLSADDPYTRYAIGDDPSSLWLIELVNAEISADDLEGEVVYDGGAMNSVPGGTWDLELVRNILQPGETAELPGHEGPALVLSSFGEIQATTASGQGNVLDTGQGQLSLGPLVLRNNGDRPVVYLVAYIGDRVLGPDETPEPSEDEAADADATPAAEGTPVPDPSEADDDGDGLTNGEEDELGTDPANPDTDGDDLEDGDELAQETDPNLLDSDNDGYPDGEEVLNFNTDPNDPESAP